MFKRATKEGSFGRLALCGVTGGGKTYTALQIAQVLAGDKRIAFIDTERGSARKYSDEFDFDVVELDSFAPSKYRECIAQAVAENYGCLIIDSLSHAWMGKDGVLEFKDAIADRAGKNSYTAWREAGEQQNMLVDAILAAPIHVIVTMRSKMEYVQEQNPKTGKTEIRKVGLQPVQRDGLEYEFDIVADMVDGRLIVGKTRCKALDKRSFLHDGEGFGREFAAWLGDAPAPAQAAQPEPEPEQPQVPEKVNEYLAVLEQYGCKPGPASHALCKKHNTKRLSNLLDSQLQAAIDALHEEFGALADATVGSGPELF